MAKPSKGRGKLRKRGGARFVKGLGFTNRMIGLSPPSRAQMEEYKAFAEFSRLKEHDKLARARAVIVDSIIEGGKQKPNSLCALAIAESRSLLSGYATLDEPHRAEISTLIDHINAYLDDSTRERPFNALMLAAPGAGKSHFIEQLANKMRSRRVVAVTFNMATIRSLDDMGQPVDELRNIKVKDQFPLLFLDEFDSDPSNYASLLPLLWEGELNIGSRELKCGKAVIVLAGSNPDLPKAMDRSAEMSLDTDNAAAFTTSGKLIDLLSRINGGVIRIPDFDLQADGRDRRVDKVCVAVSLLNKRFGRELTAVPRSLLRFIAHTTFRYGSRSMAHVVESIDRNAYRDGVLNGANLGLPIDSELALNGSSLRLHLLHKDKGFGIAKDWREFAADKAVVSLGTESAGRYFGHLSYPTLWEDWRGKRR